MKSNLNVKTITQGVGFNLENLSKVGPFLSFSRNDFWNVHRLYVYHI